MNYLEEIITQIELHSPDGIRNCFEHGINPNMLYNGEPLIFELTSEYTRTNRFSACVKLFVDYGLQFEDKVLLSVLLNDAGSLDKYLNDDHDAVQKTYTLRCAYTPLIDASLLHICAEYNHVACADVLIKQGANINARAGVDEYGFGGHTPIFHTVNQNSNQSVDMLNFLLHHQADLNIGVKGILWGKGYEWETLLPAVNPISYTMMGLLPQMHRNELVISNVVQMLLKRAYGINYQPLNIPCRYLQH
jgi:hypothetical protein